MGKHSTTTDEIAKITLKKRGNQIIGI